MSGATIGKVIALAAFLGVGGVVAFSVVRGVRETPAADGTVFHPTPAPTGEITIVDLPTGADAASDLFDTGDSWVFRSPDGDGREREYRADSLEPRGGGRIRLANPSATIPTDDGWVEVRASEGSIVRRSGGEPESGELTGGVVVTAFRAEEGAPFATFRTDRLSFQESLRELRTESEIALDAEGLTVRSRGVTARLGDTGDARTSGLLYLRLHEGGRVEVRPDGMRDSTRRDASDASGGRAKRARSTGAEPVEAFYRVLAAGDVDLVWGTATIRGDRAEVIARLVDGALVPGAITRLDGPARAEAETEGTDGGGAAGENRTPIVGGASGSTAVLTWAGALELQRVADRPEEIGATTGDEVAVRWFGIGKNPVRIADASAGFGAEVSEIRYGMTSARVRLTGKTGLRDAVVTGDGVGELRSVHSELDLGDLPRITAWVDGPGSVRPRGAPDTEATVVTWGERADLTAERAGTGEVRITSVSASGPVRMITPSGSVDSTFARAFLGERGGATILERVILRDGFHVVATPSRDSIDAEEAEIRFAAPGDGSIAGAPEFARASGAVRLTSGDARIDADTIAVELDALPTGAIGLRSADAEGSVQAVVARGVAVRGPRARVDDAGDILRIDGPGSAVTLADDAQSVEVRAQSMEVRRASGRISAAGPGTAHHRVAGTADAPEAIGDLSWTEGLVYDDATGIAELLGRVEGTRRSGDTETQRVLASGGARVSLIPGAMREDPGSSARVTGVTLMGGSDAQAEVEGRRYARGEGSSPRGPLESVVALRSDQIALDLERSVLSTPGAGVLVVEDRRGGGGDAGDAAASAFGVSSRGTTAFRWDGSFTLDRGAGVVTMASGVRVSHLDASGGDVTELFAQTLEAMLEPGEGDASSMASADAAALVRSIVARDRVRLEHRALSVECDTLDFDGALHRFTARAAAGGRVRGLDRLAGDSFLAESVRIDPRTGEWAAEGLTGISSGR